jgi:hypothetical protein
MARPTKVLSESFIDKARELSAKGNSYQTIAKKLDISLRTFQRYMQSYPAFNDAISGFGMANELENDPDIQRMTKEMEAFNVDEFFNGFQSAFTLTFKVSDGKKSVTLGQEQAFTEKEIERLVKKYKRQKMELVK